MHTQPVATQILRRQLLCYQSTALCIGLIDGTPAKYAARYLSSSQLGALCTCLLLQRLQPKGRHPQHHWLPGPTGARPLVCWIVLAGPVKTPQHQCAQAGVMAVIAPAGNLVAVLRHLLTTLFACQW
jgi:hypothetical protein